MRDKAVVEAPPLGNGDAMFADLFRDLAVLKTGDRLILFLGLIFGVLVAIAVFQ